MSVRSGPDKGVRRGRGRREEAEGGWLSVQGGPGGHGCPGRPGLLRSAQCSRVQVTSKSRTGAENWDPCAFIPNRVPPQLAGSIRFARAVTHGYNLSKATLCCLLVLQLESSCRPGPGNLWQSLWQSPGKLPARPRRSLISNAKDKVAVGGRNA